MNALSLFDGMSCGQIALKQLGIIPEKYYASEIDKHAIKQTQLNFPNTVQLGDVTKWKEWDIDWKSIDLVLAGSPCQGFSFAGKQLAFDDPRSKLFFVFIDILNHIRSLNPDVLFLLENVNMKKSHMRIISEFCGVFPVNINSNLVSAQNRNRWYWTNIRAKQVGLFGEIHSDIPQPEDKGIFLRDILEKEVDAKYYVTPKCQEYITKEFRLKKGYTQIDSEDKALPLMAKGYTNWTGDYVCVAMRGRDDGRQHLEPQLTGKTNCLTSVQKDNLIVEDVRVKGVSYTDRGIRPHRGDYRKSGVSEYGTILYTDQKSDTHIASHVGMIVEEDSPLTGIAGIRRLTPTECARLQTIPSWYKWECSDTQQYRMLGNGWTVDVIVHILSFMKEKMNINVA